MAKQLDPGCYLTLYKSQGSKVSLLKDSRNPIGQVQVDYKSGQSLDAALDLIIQPLIGPVKGNLSVYASPEAEEAIIGTGDYFSLKFVGQNPTKAPTTTHYRIVEGGYLMIRASAGMLPPNPLAQAKKAETEARKIAEDKARQEALMANLSEE